MCQSSKKEFFKKFLFEPLPVEVRTKHHTPLGLAKNAKTPKWHFLLCLFGNVPQLKPWGLCSAGREGSMFVTISPHLYIMPHMQMQWCPVLQQLRSLTAWISVMEFRHVAKTARAESTFLKAWLLLVFMKMNYPPHTYQEFLNFNIPSRQLHSSGRADAYELHVHSSVLVISCKHVSYLLISTSCKLLVLR